MSELSQTPTASRGRSEVRPNGQASLSERVRSLRLRDGAPSARPRRAWLPWGLTVIALAAAGTFGWRAYRLAPAVAPPPGQSAEGGEVKPASAPAGEAAPAARTGDVVLD